MQGEVQVFDKEIEAFSAGTKPAEKVSPMAVEVIPKIEIDTTEIE